MDTTQNVATPADKAIGVLLVIGVCVGLYVALTWWINYKVVRDAVDRYEIVAAANDGRGKCSQAENVVAAQLHANRQDEYAQWKNIAERDCVGYR